MIILGYAGPLGTRTKWSTGSLTELVSFTHCTPKSLKRPFQMKGSNTFWTYYTLWLIKLLTQSTSTHPTKKIIRKKIKKKFLTCGTQCLKRLKSVHGNAGQFSVQIRYACGLIIHQKGNYFCKNSLQPCHTRGIWCSKVMPTTLNWFFV